MANCLSTTNSIFPEEPSHGGPTHLYRQQIGQLLIRKSSVLFRFSQKSSAVSFRDFITTAGRFGGLGAAFFDASFDRPGNALARSAQSQGNFWGLHAMLVQGKDQANITSRQLWHVVEKADRLSSWFLVGFYWCLKSFRVVWVCGKGKDISVTWLYFFSVTRHS